jgi:hypothetical protein
MALDKNGNSEQELLDKYGFFFGVTMTDATAPNYVLTLNVRGGGLSNPIDAFCIGDLHTKTVLVAVLNSLGALAGEGFITVNVEKVKEALEKRL